MVRLLSTEANIFWINIGSSCHVTITVFNKGWRDSPSTTYNRKDDNVEKWIYKFTYPVQCSSAYNVKRHGSTARWDLCVVTTETYFIQASVQVGSRSLCHLQRLRRWRCCCVGWPADETQDLQGWDFLLGTPLQLDTETAVNQSHWSCVDCPLCECASVCVMHVQQMNKNPLQFRLKENISFILTNVYCTDR